MQMLWWAKDPAVESPLSSTRLSNVLELSVFTVPDGGRRLEEIEHEVYTDRKYIGIGNGYNGSKYHDTGSVRDWKGEHPTKFIVLPTMDERSGYGGRGRRKLQQSTNIPIQTSNCINISIPMEASDYALSPNYLATCVSWDEGAKDWTKDGCSIERAAADSARCCCTHLSTFGVLLENSVTVTQPEPSVITGYITSLLSGSRPEPLFAITVVLLVYFLAVAWGHARDQQFKEEHKEEEYKIKETKDLFANYKRHLEQKHGGHSATPGITPAPGQKRGVTPGKKDRPRTPSEIVLSGPDGLSKQTKRTPVARPTLKGAQAAAQSKAAAQAGVAEAAKSGYAPKSARGKQPKPPQAPPRPGIAQQMPQAPPRPTLARKGTEKLGDVAALNTSVGVGGRGKTHKVGDGAVQQIGTGQSPDAKDLALAARMQGGGGAADEPEPQPEALIPPPRPAPPPGGPSRPVPPSGSSARPTNSSETSPRDSPPVPKPPPRPPADGIDRPSTFTQDKVAAAQAASQSGTDMSVTSIDASPLPGQRDIAMEVNPALPTTGAPTPRSIVDTFAAPGGKPPPPSGQALRPGRGPVKTPRRLRGKGLRKASTSTPPGTAGRVRIMGMDVETKDDIATGAMQKRLSPAPWARHPGEGGSPKAIEPSFDYDSVHDIRPGTAESQPDDELTANQQAAGAILGNVMGKGKWPPPKTDMKMQTKEAKAATKQGMRKGYAGKVKKAYTTDSGDGLPAFCPKFCQTFYKSLAKYHLLVSILAAGPHALFTRPQRATVAASVLLLEMAGAAVATRYLPCDENKSMYVGIAAACLTAPLAYALAKLFIVTGQKYRESGSFLRDFAVQKKRQHDGDPSARAKLQQMVTHDAELAETSGRAQCGRFMRKHAKRFMQFWDWSSAKLKNQFQSNHEDDAASAAGSGPGSRNDTPTFNVGSNDEVEMIRRKNETSMAYGETAGGLRGDALPPEATFRYYLWRWLHHAIYCCCFLVAVSASFNVIFYGMKFDEGHVQCWFTGCMFSIATDYLILQPFVALFWLHGDRRVAAKQRAALAAKRAALSSTIAFRDKQGRGPQKTEWTADDFGA